MATGCTGPFVNGTGGWCGCNCKCCPPADMVTSVTVVFGPPPPLPLAETTQRSNYAHKDLNLPGPPQEIPSFDNKAILSKDKRFLFGGPSMACSVPCNTWSILLTPAAPAPVCGFQVHDCVIKAVGNGWVQATPSTYVVPDCGTIKVEINGLDSPVYVTDGSIITITLTYTDPWNIWCCACVEVCPTAGMSVMSLLRYKTTSGKQRIDPETGLPIVVIDKAELLRRVIERRQRLRRKK